eukprot:gb/GFBE01046543.1/.p1 GENE.gb/GFBE01046543.1/~~gb/GFBE01046543.1/.p1  ORF type:complete len:251 (+),score=26.08 gb/GFBE01046543.1/:1-753(+)
MAEEDWTPQGPIRPDRNHPEWQMSIPAHFVDRQSGAGNHRGLKQINTPLKEGCWGIASQGLGGYMTDVRGKLEQDFSEGRRAHPMSRFRSDEIAWRPGRRACSGPMVSEPEKITGRPPFVPRHGSFVTSHSARCLPPVYDQQGDRFTENILAKEQRRRVQKARKEVRDAKRLVEGLDEWEGELPMRCATKTSPSPLELAGYASKSRGLGSMVNDTPESPFASRYASGMRGSASDSRLEAPAFCRQRPAYS